MQPLYFKGGVKSDRCSNMHCIIQPRKHLPPPSHPGWYLNLGANYSRENHWAVFRGNDNVSNLCHQKAIDWPYVHMIQMAKMWQTLIWGHPERMAQARVRGVSPKGEKVKQPL